MKDGTSRRNTKSMGQDFPWESHVLPLLFPCLKITTNSRVCSNNPSFTLLCFFFLTNCCLDVEERKWIGGDLRVRLSPCISPPAEVQSKTLWTRSGDLMSFSPMARSWRVGCVPTPALTSPLVGASVTGCLSCSGKWVDEPVIVVFWLQELYVKKGKWQCVWLKLQ